MTLFVADVVLCELAWVLTSRHKLSRVHIAEALDNLLAAELIVVADEGVASRAVSAYRAGKGDFADNLIKEQASAAEASDVVTFDRTQKGEFGFRILA